MLHGRCMWPNVIDELLWPFAIKDVAERLNRLQVDLIGQTPESILHGVVTEDIPVKSYHTLLCPTYVLDARLHSSGGAVPPKWEQRSRIWSISGTLALPCWQRGSCVGSNHRLSNLSIPCCVRRQYYRALYGSRYAPTQLVKDNQTLIRNGHN